MHCFKPLWSSRRWFHDLQPLGMTEHYSLVHSVAQDYPALSLAAGGQDVGDMRVEGRDPGARR